MTQSRNSSTLLLLVVAMEVLYLCIRTFINTQLSHSLTAFQSELAWSGLRLVSIVAILIALKRYGVLPEAFKWPKMTPPVLVILLLLGVATWMTPTDHNPDVLLKYTFAVTSLLVAVREELVYRYVLQNWAQQQDSGNPYLLPVLVPSVLFTFYHLGAQPIAQFPLIFVTSCLLGWVYIASGKSLFLIVVCHCLIDVYVALF